MRLLAYVSLYVIFFNCKMPMQVLFQVSKGAKIRNRYNQVPPALYVLLKLRICMQSL